VARHGLTKLSLKSKSSRLIKLTHANCSGYPAPYSFPSTPNKSDIYLRANRKPEACREGPFADECSS